MADRLDLTTHCALCGAALPGVDPVWSCPHWWGGHPNLSKDDAEPFADNPKLLCPCDGSELVKP